MISAQRLRLKKTDAQWSRFDRNTVKLSYRRLFRLENLSWKSNGSGFWFPLRFRQNLPSTIVLVSIVTGHLLS